MDAQGKRTRLALCVAEANASDDEEVPHGASQLSALSEGLYQRRFHIGGRKGILLGGGG